MNKNCAKRPDPGSFPIGRATVDGGTTLSFIVSRVEWVHTLYLDWCSVDCCFSIVIAIFVCQAEVHVYNFVVVQLRTDIA